MEEPRRRFPGLVAAAHTPLRADGSLDLGTVERLAARFVRDRLAGVFVCGTTGEFAALTASERIDLAARWCAVAGDSLPVAVHVGGCALDEARALAEHAQRAGARAIAAVAPFYFRPGSTEDLVEAMAVVAAGAPELPFFYYHIPGLTGVRLSVSEFLGRASGRIPNLAGLKFSDLDMIDLNRALRLDGGRFEVLFGIDEVLLSALALGVTGAVGTTYSFAAGLYDGVRADFAAGRLREARDKQARATEMVAAFARYGLHPAMKAAMAFTGIDCGPVRLPQRSLVASQLDSLRRELDALGFFSFASRG